MAIATAKAVASTLMVTSSSSLGFPSTAAPFEVITTRLSPDPDSGFTNNAQWPLIVYKHALRMDEDEDEGQDQGCDRMVSLMVSNGWTRPWAWGVFSYHHYHSTAWEALLCVQGSADIQLGGPQGPTFDVQPGDCLLIPPGVAHKQLSEQGGFTLLGAYPDHNGCRTPSADTCRRAPTAKQQASIERCPAPLRCPLFGTDLAVALEL
uniref:Cupin type-2 domain-containing protein n=1 Tax=Florenciella parvula TaxID=236787 RepID=A0A7S2BYP1_9STRA|mmetsp:Transcript_22283/g.46362  ORF Transcript_22283/g.46362 Transcript_22283/m.46362 type:complete len:207 (+) Transcript_22283:63-683(+)|eukprot:CAMPEP_0182540480 /NCGR_PEP_ID=MMETSP1323-20130603/27125_1 /TAXON_ID=236787 /ORGANISM="Florenciella parvula, Strain RCC1693" /LENGTH=206 /DNA_ID=CAMNT_0024751145 /DNA_START=63 /DNA_END=683 /DNA_ORIENTATION=+